MSAYRFHSRLRATLYEVVFGTDTPAGRGFDIALIWAILISVVAVMLDSVQSISGNRQWLFNGIEWFFTLLFSLEYLVRLYCAPKPLHYARSFFGLVDLLSVLPTYLAFFVSHASFLIMLRLLRVLRIFRVLKLMRYINEADLLVRSLYMARRKIFVFFFSMFVLASIFGALLFLIEGPANGFTSIPKSIYWAVITMTTVGYGDVVPQTVLGQSVATLLMGIGYAIIAVPTGIVTAEIAVEMHRERSANTCRNCGRPGHDVDALHCKFCGARLHS